MTECCPAGQTGLRMPRLERLRGASARTADQNLTCVFQTYGDAVLRAAYAYLYNMEDAQDAVQDTFLQYFHTAPVLEAPNTKRRGCCALPST